MSNLKFNMVDELLINKYKAEKVNKQQFKQLLYGFNRNDLSDDISELTEGIIKTDNANFYLINDVEILNKHCKCVNSEMYPNGKVMPMPLSMFYPYIIIVVELSKDGLEVVNYAKWGSFSDDIFEEFGSLTRESKNIHKING